MAITTKIQWTEATWNPWHGCKKVSPGCKFCYMYRDKERFNLDPSEVVKSKSGFKKPLSWKEPKLIFTCSWSDWFIEEADQWRNEAWEIIRNTPQHTYQILTKRPERILNCLPDDWDGGENYPNVWIGISAENQGEFDKRILKLVGVMSVVRFISIEPLLGPINMNHLPHIDWVIIGGESGNDTGKYRYRECQIDWMEDIIEQCGNAKIPVFVKQMGTHLAKEWGMKDRHGGNIDEFPAWLQVREMPKIVD